MNHKGRYLLLLMAALLLCSAAVLLAAYRAKAWVMGARESYPASLTSEGVTIAAQPLADDARAAQVFDKKDMVTRGIMPLAILIFNDNDFGVEVDGLSIELLWEGERVRSLTPAAAAGRLFGTTASAPGQPARPSNRKALEDFDDKFLARRSVPARGRGGGFLYLPVGKRMNLPASLAGAVVYIPHIYREDDGSRLIFFEIDLKAAVAGAGPQPGDGPDHGTS